MKKSIPLIFISTFFVLCGCQNKKSSSIEPEPKMEFYIVSPNRQVRLGEFGQFSYELTMPDGSQPKVSWLVFRDEIAVVNENGRFYGKAPGTTDVYAFIDNNDNGIIDGDDPVAEASLTVLDNDGQKTLVLDNPFVNINDNETQDVTVSVIPAPENPSAYYYYYLSWKSDDTSIAGARRLSSDSPTATIIPTGVGETRIRLSFGSLSATVIVNVNPWIEGDITHVGRVELNTERKTIIKENEESSYQLEATVYPETASDKNVIYSSNNEAVATVNDNGLVTFHSGGRAIITATTRDRNRQDSAIFIVQDISKTYRTDYYNNYYESLTSWENGEDLINKLHNIIYDYTPIKYDWDVIKDADEAIDNPKALDALYSKYDILKTEQATGFSREHTFPASLMTGFSTGNATSQKGRATDYHNLYAASTSGNSSRNNKNYGTADIWDNRYAVGADGSYSFDVNNFEPHDQDKGKAARAIFYMATMYNLDEEANVTDTLNYNDADQQTYGHASKTVHIPYTQKALVVREQYAEYSKISFSKFHYHTDEETTDLYNEYVTTDTSELDFEALLEVECEAYGRYSTDNCEFAIGGLSSLLDWSSQQVNYVEYRRNDIVQAAQGNRNPFSDYPELVDYAFGAFKDQPGQLANLKPSTEILNTTGDDVIAYRISDYPESCVVGTTFNKDSYTLEKVHANFTTSSVNPSEYSLEEYVFTEEDLSRGYTYVDIKTPINTITLKIKVTEDDMSVCNYAYQLVGTSNHDGRPADLKDFVNGGTATFGDLQWKISWTGASAAVDKTFNAGVAFGTGSNPVNTITFETINSLTNVEAFFAKVNCGSGKTVDYTMYVGDTVVCSGSYTGTGQNAEPLQIGKTFSLKEGKVKIVISKATSFAIHMHTLALKY